jgi:hypothetical protein
MEKIRKLNSKAFFQQKVAFFGKNVNKISGIHTCSSIGCLITSHVLKTSYSKYNIVYLFLLSVACKLSYR